MRLSRFESIVPILKNFSETNRLAIIALLSNGPMQVGDITEAISLPLTLVSQHLRILRQTGLVEAHRGETDARVVRYRLNPEKLREVEMVLNRVFDCTKIIDPRQVRTTGTEIPSRKARVLFLCTGNSARSQIAEVLLREMGEGVFEAQSAGFSPRNIHPFTFRVLEEKGFPTGGLRAKHFNEMTGEAFNYLITVCDRANEDCPVRDGFYERLHWSISDPVRDLPETELYSEFLRVREELEERIRLFILARRNEAYRRQFIEKNEGGL